MFQFLIDRLQRFETRRSQVVARWLATPPQESHLHGRKYIHHPANFGDQLADRIAETMGSWRFIIAQTCIVVFWMLLNVAIIDFHWDPYPFILLNLLFSTQAAYASPLIIMSQNRQAAKDRARDDHEAQEVDEIYLALQDIKQSVDSAASSAPTPVGHDVAKPKTPRPDARRTGSRKRGDSQDSGAA